MDKPPVFWGKALPCLAMSLLLASSWILASITFHTNCEQRDIGTLGGAAGSLLLAYAALRRPGMLAKRQTPVIACTVSALTGIVMLLASSHLPVGIGFVIASCVHSITDSVILVIVGLSLLPIPRKHIPVVLATSYCLKFGWVVLLGNLHPWAKSVAFILFPLIAACIGFRYARPALSHISSRDPAGDLLITDPPSVSPLSIKFFIFLLFFSIASGFASSTGKTDGSINFLVWSTLGSILLLLFTLEKRSIALDGLYCCSFFLITTGFLLIPWATSNLGGIGPLPNIVLSWGSAMLIYTTWLIVIELGNRNVICAPPMLFLYAAAIKAGIRIGAMLDRGMTDLPQALPTEMQLLPVTVFALLFIIYNFLLVRGGFSFDAMSDAIKEAPPVRTTVGDTTSTENNTFLAACRQLSKEYRLTRREEEILTLMARGRNVAYMQESLALSRNTIKTHVANLYGKMDVHTHQELIDTVEQRTKELLP